MWSSAWLSISRGTLDNWRKAKKDLALRKGLRNFVYPTRQFHRSRLLEGIDFDAEHFAAPEDAWAWLAAPNRITGGKPPIEALRDGGIAPNRNILFQGSAQHVRFSDRRRRNRTGVARPGA